mmetsp:Transcript_18440/g.46379  ORF Transcript_18440/g.46379 Transcript_18440/m.46379 type:complete len:311 (-) Transcript_18440:462-1394(-)
MVRLPTRLPLHPVARRRKEPHVPVPIPDPRPRQKPHLPPPPATRRKPHRGLRLAAVRRRLDHADPGDPPQVVVDVGRRGLEGVDREPAARGVHGVRLAVVRADVEHGGAVEGGQLDDELGGGGDVVLEEEVVVEDLPRGPRDQRVLDQISPRFRRRRRRRRTLPHRWLRKIQRRLHRGRLRPARHRLPALPKEPMHVHLRRQRLLPMQPLLPPRVQMKARHARRRQHQDHQHSLPPRGQLREVDVRRRLEGGAREVRDRGVGRRGAQPHGAQRGLAGREGGVARGRHGGGERAGGEVEGARGNGAAEGHG